MSIYEYDEKKQRRFDREEGREEGLEEGIEIGNQTRTIILVQKKVKKGKTLDIIADELESTVEEIKPIYDAVLKFPTDTDPKEIYLHI